MLAFSVALSLHALVALQSPAAPPAATATGDQTILWFRTPDAAPIDARALLDAISVYTRDLGLSVRTAAETRAVPSDAASASDAVATLRAQGARLGFWCELRPGGDVAALTVVETDGHVEQHLVERTGAHEAEQFRAIALKLRSVLVGTASPEPAVVVPPPPAPAPPPPAPPPAPPAPAGPDLAVRAQPPAPPPSTRLFVTVGYRLSTPLASASARHALALEGSLALGRVLELDVGTELAGRREEIAQLDTGTMPTTDVISLFDWPFMLGARAVWRGPRVTLGGGPFAALHLLWASANGSDPMQQSAFTTAGGAGAELLARLRLAGALAGELRLYGEVAVPTTSYSLRHTNDRLLAFGTRAGLAIGLVFPAP
ncbi:MAG TPA: hypothetical protein VIF57_25080 [Polyangia bacterium]